VATLAKKKKNDKENSPIKIGVPSSVARRSPVSTHCYRFFFFFFSIVYSSI
jgi:hypothetical protein